MGRKKGCVKTGGRVRGTPNKITTSLKSWIKEVIDENREDFEDDIKNLEGNDRIRVITNLLPFVIPKIQSASPEELLDVEYDKLQELLESAPDEAIERISERIKQIQDERDSKKTED